jgi:hypothetical protein
MLKGLEKEVKNKSELYRNLQLRSPAAGSAAHGEHTTANTLCFLKRMEDAIRTCVNGKCRRIEKKLTPRKKCFLKSG